MYLEASMRLFDGIYDTRYAISTFEYWDYLLEKKTSSIDSLWLHLL